MTPPDDRILDFIGEHHILTLAVSAGNKPYCATCFYVYLPEQNIFVFTSDPDTKHIRDCENENNFHVAAAIALETKITGKIRGLQITGMMRKLNGKERKAAKKKYLEKFPVARFSKLHLWSLEPDFIKMTDNRLGFGKKLMWKS